MHIVPTTWNRRVERIGLGWALASALVLCPAAAQAATPTEVAWRHAAGDQDIEQAFALARQERKPVLLYWGAKWCPPCNQLKATLFNRQDFVERSKAVVPVNLDGDQPGAQKLAARFRVRGYPTMILLAPDGGEITRLPGEADAPQVIAMLQRGQAGGRSVKTLLADARSGRTLAPGEWRALALYAWDTDEEQLVAEAERPGLLAQLAANCPRSDADASARLLLRALAASTESAGLKSDAGVRDRVRKLLRDPVLARAQMESLVNFAPEIAKALAPDAGTDRRATVAALDAALRRLESDASLSRLDRLSALLGRVELARLGQGKAATRPRLDAALVQRVREHAARADREITDAYERQAVITSAAHMLGQAGLWAESDALLQANLARSHSPYYLMSQLGGNARKLGRKDEALRWYQKAFEASEGPATRLQWGDGYVAALVELAPQDDARIEKAVALMIAEAAQDRSAFYERSARSLQRTQARLKAWNSDGSHAAVVERLRRQLTGVCSRLEASDTQRASCDALARGLAAQPA